MKDFLKKLFNFIWYDLLPVIIMLVICLGFLYFVYFKII